MFSNYTPSCDSTVTKLLTWKPVGSLHIPPVPKNLDQWTYTLTRDREVRSNDEDRVWGIWLSLKPFFDSKGYELFGPTDEKCSLVPSKSPTSQTAPKSISDFPFARKFYDNDFDIRFMSSVRPITLQRIINLPQFLVAACVGGERSQGERCCDSVGVLHEHIVPIFNNHY